jgi:N-formylmaleamate deformylase
MREEHQDSDQLSTQLPGYIGRMVPPHWHETTVRANDIQQHYYRTGGEKPALILLHGFSENGLCWSRVAKALERDYDLIMLDARGHGRSSGPEAGYSQDLLTQDIAGLIYALGLGGPGLFGHSNGALTAAHVAATFPDLVRAVILEDPPWGEAPLQPQVQATGNEPWPGFTTWYQSWIAWHRALRTQLPEERMASCRQFLPLGAFDWPEEELMFFLESQAQFNLDVLNVVPFVPTLSPWHETVERITCPILLLTGNPKRGAMVTPQEAEKIAATWQEGQHVAFAEASHFMHREMQGTSFDRFIYVVKAFLSEV